MCGFLFKRAHNSVTLSPIFDEILHGGRLFGVLEGNDC